MKTTKLNVNEARWHKNVELLKEYVETKGALPNRTTEYKGVKLGVWFVNQMRAYRMDKLSYNRENVLRSLGVDFNTFDREERWLNNYELFREYITNKGSFPINITNYKGVKLGVWYDDQKRAYRKGKLIDSRERMLRSIGVTFDTYTNKERWIRRFELLQEYVETEGSLPKQLVKYKGINIGLWLNQQRGAYNKGGLSSIQEKQLRSLGVALELNVYEDRWLKNYDLLKEYKIVEGKLPSVKTVYKDNKIGGWLFSQKQVYKKGKLSSSRESMLRSVGVEF